MDEEEGGTMGRDAVEDDTVERGKTEESFVIRVIKFTVGCIKAVWVECM